MRQSCRGLQYYKNREVNMIWLTESSIEASIGRINFIIRIDAKAARIEDSSKMGSVQEALNSKILGFSNDIRDKKDYSEYEQELKEYLCNDLFKYGIDVVAVNDFIYDLRINIIKFSENISITGFSIDYKYKNYEGEMIKLVRAEVSSGDQVYFTVRIDADIAKIRNRDEKNYVESQLGLKMIGLAHVIKGGQDHRDKEEALSYYLRKELFDQLIDLKVINTFIKDFKNKVVGFMEDIKKIGFDIVFEYKNHPWEKEDEDNKKRWDEWDRKHKK